MSKEEIFEELTNIISKIMDIQSNELTKEDNLVDLGINSIIIIKMVVEIEKVFGFEFADEDLVNNKFIRIEDLMCYISERKNLS